MFPSFVVEVDKAFAFGVEGHAISGRIQVEVLMFEGAPEALDEDIVDCAALAVHADPDTFGRAAFAE